MGRIDLHTLVSSEKDGQLIAVNYVETVLTIDDKNRLTYVNGSGKDGLIVHFTKILGKRNITIKNCMGDILVSSERTIECGVMHFDVPRAEMLIIDGDM